MDSWKKWLLCILKRSKCCKCFEPWKTISAWLLNDSNKKSVSTFAASMPNTFFLGLVLKKENGKSDNDFIRIRTKFNYRLSSFFKTVIQEMRGDFKRNDNFTSNRPEHWLKFHGTKMRERLQAFAAK